MAKRREGRKRPSGAPRRPSWLPASREAFRKARGCGSLEPGVGGGGGGACYCPGGYPNSGKFSLSLRSPHRSGVSRGRWGGSVCREELGGLPLLSSPRGEMMREASFWETAQHRCAGGDAAALRGLRAPGARGRRSGTRRCGSCQLKTQSSTGSFCPEASASPTPQLPRRANAELRASSGRRRRRGQGSRAGGGRCWWPGPLRGTLAAGDAVLAWGRGRPESRGTRLET